MSMKHELQNEKKTIICNHYTIFPHLCANDDTVLEEEAKHVIVKSRKKSKQ